MTTLTAIATTIKTVQIDYTEAQIIRSVARRDIPEYGLTEGQVFYCTRSSKNDGTYYISTWNFERMQWTCRCPATTNNCRHNRLVKADCSKQHSLQGYKPVSKERKFAEMLVAFDARYQVPSPVAKVVVEAEVIVKAAQLNRPTTNKFELAPSGRLVPMR